MFTGIIQELGTIKKISRKAGLWALDIEAPVLLTRVYPGDSIAVNGVCLTVTGKSPRSFSVDVVKATLSETNLKRLKVGEKVNLELALSVGDKLSGHFVLGHVDCEGRIKKISRRSGDYVFSIEHPVKFKKYLVDKCSIAVDGISLTVQKVFTNYFIVSIIPYTLKHTNLQYRRSGERLNLEFDYLLKRGSSS